MNIITADFDWASVLGLVVTIAILYFKPNKGKKRILQETDTPEVFEDTPTQEPDFQHLEEPIPQVVEEPSLHVEEQHMPGDWHRTTTKGEVAENHPVLWQEKEEEEEHAPLFDIRQAVISSEILRRPEF